MPHAAATASGVNGAASARDLVDAVRRGRRPCRGRRGRRRRARARARTRSSASVAGRMARCSSASSAVFVRRGIDDDEPAAARRAARAADPGMSGAVMSEPFDANGFAPSIEQVVGAVDVGHRDRERAAEHQTGRHLLRHLVDGARRVHVLRARRLQQHAVVDETREVVRVRIAEVHRERVGAVLLADRRESRVDRRERLVPRHLVERRRRAGSAAGGCGPDRPRAASAPCPSGTGSRG